MKDEKAAADLLPAIAAGERIVVLAHQEPKTRGELNHVATRAEKSGDSYVLDGHKSVVVHGGAADEFLISARTAGKTDDRQGVSIFRVTPQTPGVKLNVYRTIDGLHAAEIELTKAKVPGSQLVGAAGEAFDAIESALDIGLSAICAEAVGIMKAVNAATLEYTRNRKQFGVPIAKFQVLQHRMADMFLQSEQA